jgi:hypothetical protein
MTILVDLPLLILRDRKIGGPVGCWNNYLAIDNRGPGCDVPRIGGDLFKAVGPIMAAPGEHLHRFIRDMHLHAVAVELDLMQPALAGWHPRYGCRECWRNEARKLALTPTAAGFLRWNATILSRRRRTQNEGRKFVPFSGTGTNVDHYHRAKAGRTKWQSEKQTSRGRKQDRSRVAGGQAYEVRYEAKNEKVKSRR